jgi:hypothetical protein
MFHTFNPLQGWNNQEAQATQCNKKRALRKSKGGMGHGLMRELVGEVPRLTSERRKACDI